MTAGNYYQSRKESYGQRLSKVKKKSARIAILRLLTLAAGIYFFIKAISSGLVVLYPAALLLIILFIALIVYHRNLNYRASVLKLLIRINEKEIIALKGDYSIFEDGGEFLNIHHEFTYDLDIFGRSSLFQFINRCCTLEGKKKLAGSFVNSPLPEDEIKRNQITYRELSKHPDFMQHFLATGMLTEDQAGEKEEVISWLNERSFDQSRVTKWLSIFLAVTNTAIIIAGIFHPPFFNYLYISIPLSWLFYGAFIKRINSYHSVISRKQSILGKYIELNRIIASKKFDDKILDDLCKHCQRSLKEFKKLDRLTNYLDNRLNLLVGLILNSLFLFDLHIIRMLENWKKRNPELGNNFFEIPAIFDSTISLSIFCYNHPEFPMPVISNERFIAEEIGHPLIHASERVGNNFRAGDKNHLFIITGANMAGKSTFLRTLGINMILAGIGAPVCARSMKFKPLKLITGMRTTDSLAESESYFFAELKRLHKIVEELDKGKSLMILLDEILKGTNSTDKHKGSVALVQKLAGLDCLALIATHDLTLGEQEKNFPEAVSNYCFESYIKDGELIFDYKLKKGIAKNMNAYFLMKKMGIVSENQ